MFQLHFQNDFVSQVSQGIPFTFYVTHTVEVYLLSSVTGYWSKRANSDEHITFSLIRPTLECLQQRT